MDEDALYPYRTTPKRIADDVVAALEACPAVGRVTLFGSVAEGRHDCWSDIDVRCAVAGLDAAEAAASLLRRTLAVRWWGEYSAGPPPGGRYWLYGESPFHAVDLVFDVAGRPGDGPDGPGNPPAENPARAAEREFTHCLSSLFKRMRAYLRASDGWTPVAEGARLVDEAAASLPKRPTGGDARGIAQEARTLYHALLMERARYGGDR